MTGAAGQLGHDDRRFVLPLRDAHDPDLVGGKAVNLAALLQAGLPVPDGFVVTTAAFHAGANGQAIPAAVAAQIRAAYDRLGRPLVAARSSATAEDLAEASMAGQYETLLNLATPDALLDAMAQCWASARNARIQTYLKEHGLAAEAVAMAVIVQRLVAADVAGVLFTANPRTGSREEMLVEAAWGLGEAVVSGAVQPDVIRLRTHDCAVLEYTVADKQVHLPAGARERVAVPDAQRRRACLNYAALRELWRLGRRAARHFDGPQDLEWARSDGRVWVLQSRAITTLDTVAVQQTLLSETRARLHQHLDAGRGPWVSHNLAETLPHPTPFTWSLVRRFMTGQGGFGRMYRAIGFEPSPVVADDGFLELIGGTVYMDCARMPEMFAAGYPFTYDVARLRANPDAAQQPPTVPRRGLGAHTKAAKLGAAVAARLRAEAQDLDRRFDQEYVPALQAWCRAEERRELAALEVEALIALWHQRETKVMDEFGAMAFLPSMVAARATAELRALLDEHVWEEDPDALTQELGVSPTPDRTFAANVELHEAALGERSFAQWLADHGHRAPAEFELATPRWSERPGDLRPLAEQVKANTDLVGKHHARVRQAQACLARLQGRLPARLRGELAQRAALLQRYARFREDGKYHWMRAYAVLRQTALEFGRRLGVRDTVFFLTPAEVCTALRTGFVPEDLIARRQVRHQAEDRMPTPRVIDREALATLGQPVVPDGAAQWPAYPVSGGCALGPVRVVLNPETAPRLETGSLLVCPSTDPSWTPLFVNAAGLVLERGGTLSHGAIVAREMGLPAVVLEGATTLFQDGDWLTVDGQAGWVSRSTAEQTDPIRPRSSSSKPKSEIKDENEDEERGRGRTEQDDDANNIRVERQLQPPPVSAKERRCHAWALAAAVGWLLFLAAVYVLPAAGLREPVFGLIDFAVWPLVPRLGMPGTVAVVAGALALLLVAGQRWFTDNARLFEAKRRAGLLRKQAARLPVGSPRRRTLEQLAAPVTTRLLQAAMFPLAMVLGPLMMMFLWFPERVHPAVWSADPGRTVNVVAEVDGDLAKPVTLAVPAPLALDEGSPATQTLPPIRAELEELRAEWQSGSDLSPFPWEVQTAAEHAREAMLASLNAYLRAGVPPQKLIWQLRVPEDADGHYEVRVTAPEGPRLALPLGFGRSRPPAPGEVTSEQGVIRSVSAVYPRALTQRAFWTPLVAFGGPAWDGGWLTVYLLAYLAVMFSAKPLLRVP